MTLLKAAEIALFAYLLGSIPFGLILVRLVQGEDIRAKGSGNIGATNVIRSGAKGLGALTFLLDALKGIAAVLIAERMVSSLGAVRLEDADAVAAFFAVIGHIFPVWLRFKGGKGVATAFGVFIAMAPFAALTGLAAFLIVFLRSRTVSLASIVGAAVFPLAEIFIFHKNPAGNDKHDLLFLTVVVLLPVLVIAMHRKNIVRLMNGTEFRFNHKKEA